MKMPDNLTGPVKDLDPTVRRRLLAVGVLTAIVLIALAVQWAWRSAPQIAIDVVPAGAEDPDSVVARTLTCERTLPDAPSRDLDTVEPVGRVSSAAVNSCPDAFDGQVVVYFGEVVGDVLQRDEGAWLLVNDDDYALEVGPLAGHVEFRGGNSGLAVWMPEGLSDLADEPGNASRRGDILRIEGVVRRTDPTDGGGLTLRAINAEVVVEAQYVETPVNRVQLGIAIAFTLIAGAVLLWDRRSRARR